MCSTNKDFSFLYAPSYSHALIQVGFPAAAPALWQGAVMGHQPPWGLKGWGTHGTINLEVPLNTGGRATSLIIVYVF